MIIITIRYLLVFPIVYDSLIFYGNLSPYALKQVRGKILTVFTSFEEAFLFQPFQLQFRLTF